MNNYLNYWKMGLLLVVASAAAMIFASSPKNPLQEEKIFIASSYTYLKTLDYRLGINIPALPKIINALPMVFLKIPINKEGLPWSSSNAQDFADEMFGKAKEAANRAVTFGRILSICAVIFLIFAVYVTSQSILGWGWGILPAALTAYSLILMRLGKTANADAWGTLFTFLAIEQFIKFLHKPNLNNLIFSGVAFGCALASSFESAALVILLPTLLITYIAVAVERILREDDPATHFNKIFILIRKQGGDFLKIFGLAIAVLYVTYFAGSIFNPIQKQVTDTEAATQNIVIRWLSENSALRPLGAYGAGVAQSMRRFEIGNFWPIKFMLSESTAGTIIFVFALMLGALRFFQSILRYTLQKEPVFLDYLRTNFREFSFIVFIMLIGIFSFRNFGLQDTFALLPFLNILTGSSLKNWFANFDKRLVRNFLVKILIYADYGINFTVKSATITALIFWYIFSAIKSSLLR